MENSLSFSEIFAHVLYGTILLVIVFGVITSFIPSKKKGNKRGRGYED